MIVLLQMQIRTPTLCSITTSSLHIKILMLNLVMSCYSYYYIYVDSTNGMLSVSQKNAKFKHTPGQFFSKQFVSLLRVFGN